MDEKCVLILNNIQKIKNVQLMIQSALAFGVRDVCIVGLTRLRICEHAWAHTDVMTYHTFESLMQVRDFLHERKVHILGIEILYDAQSVTLETKPFFRSRTAIIMGNEGSGLSQHQAAICDGFVYIPQYGEGTASLNVTVAASIIMHEFSVWAKKQKLIRQPTN